MHSFQEILVQATLYKLFTFNNEYLVEDKITEKGTKTIVLSFTFQYYCAELNIWKIHEMKYY